MGDRHIFSTAQGYEIDNDSNWNPIHPEQPYGHLGRADALENSVVYPAESTPIDEVSYPSDWNTVSRSNGHSPMFNSIEVPNHQTDASSYEPFMHSEGSFTVAPEHFAHHASSSSYVEQTFPGAEGRFVDSMRGDGRGSLKRKSPGAPVTYERGSSSGYFTAGSSSGLSSSDIWQEKSDRDSHHAQWDCHPFSSSHRGSNLSVGSEATQRNVRSRAAPDMDRNSAGTRLSNTQLPYGHGNGIPSENSGSIEYMGQNSTSISEWNHNNHVPPAAHGRVVVPGSSGFSQETNNFMIGSSNAGGSLDIGEYHNDFISTRNPMLQHLPDPVNEPARGVRSNYTYKSNPSFRGASSSNLYVANQPAFDERSQWVTEGYSSRHPRPVSATGWRSSDRGARTRLSGDRYRITDEVAFHDRLARQGHLITNHSSAHHRSRNILDQHRDMRLDIDNMSYEELLALGERIGSVSTGLSEDLIPKCLTESIYCSSDECQEEGACVICLEEYRNMDDVGTFKNCRHDFHAECIRKWLSMKNSCPICKAAAVADDVKAR